jgi:hypothetical protein
MIHLVQATKNQPHSLFYSIVPAIKEGVELACSQKAVQALRTQKNRGVTLTTKNCLELSRGAAVATDTLSTRT